MTEYQRKDDLLARLLDTPEAATPLDATPAHTPPLTRRDERALLHAANQAGTPTLAPQEPAANEPSFAGDVVGFVRRYPVPSLLAGVAVAYLLARRR